MFLMIVKVALILFWEKNGDYQLKVYNTESWN